MSDGEFLLGLLGLLLGLAISDLLSRAADAIHNRKTTAVGSLVPMLAVSIVFGLTSTWVGVWQISETVRITQGLVTVTVILASASYISAALVFPRGGNQIVDLNDHYRRYKITVVVLLFTLTVVSSFAKDAFTGLPVGEWMRNTRLQDLFVFMDLAAL